MITVRTANEVDCETILGINAVSRPHVASLDRRELQRLNGIGAHILVAEPPARAVVGYLIAFTHRHDYDGEEFLALRGYLGGAFLYIDQIAIRTESRRSGSGLALYEAARTLAEQLGIENLCCEVNIEPPNPRSMAFHQKLGFRQLGVLEVRDGRKVALLTRGVRESPRPSYAGAGGDLRL